MVGRIERSFEGGDICPECRKDRVALTKPGVVTCTSSSGCNFEYQGLLLTTTDYDQLKYRLDIIISNQRRVY